ncbi:response regulator [Gordonia alkanivorans]|uniref:Putative two-component response regulator n=1 Tax=Gordonia alkanivorans NBRC 16433 TaxID=1027371 RepID=F9VVL5_9ACTN|nr:response regulator transcription factor [Gordonia alkanivorans]GAA12644.1 putative two-component response regulator [Gordonia alkanivorans NBRC 16433]
MTGTAPIRTAVTEVIVVDDHPVVAQGIERLIDRTGDFRVVGTTYSGLEGLNLARRLRPDIAILDLRLGHEDGADICQRMLTEVPGIRVVMLTAFGDRARLRQCLESGASGVLLKGTLDLDLSQALREVVAGQIVVDRGVEKDLRVAQTLLDESEAPGLLRPREVEVLRLIGRGMTTKAIATELGLTVNTVRSYTQDLMARLDAHTRVQAVVAAQQLGLI